MSFYIRCPRGHSHFVVTAFDAEDGDGNPTGARFVLLACTECGAEDVLEVKEGVWRKAIRKVMEKP